jgi:hypothetical protein
MGMLARDCIDVMSEVAEGLAYLTPIEPIAMPTPAQVEMVVAVNYNEMRSDGLACKSGVVYVGLGPDLPRTLAINMLGCPDRGEIDDEVACEAALEMANVLTGNLLPVIYGVDREFRLSSPRRAPYLISSGLQTAALSTEEGVLAVVVHEMR